MQLNLRFRNVKAYFGLVRFDVVEGYNSRLPDGQHCLFWDFDDVDLSTIRFALEVMQRRYKLSTIYILQTSRGGYHANCWREYPWTEARTIVANTPFVDKKFLAISIIREFFTLRFSPGGWGAIRPVAILPSNVPEDVDPLKLTSFARYKKTRKGG